MDRPAELISPGACFGRLRALTPLLATLALFAPTQVHAAEPFTLTHVSPEPGSTFTATAGGISWSVQAAPELSISVRVSNGSSTGSDGHTLSSSEQSDYFDLTHEALADEMSTWSYQGHSEAYSDGWTNTPGTYHWQMYATGYETRAGEEPRLVEYESPIFSIVILPQPTVPPPPPPLSVGLKASLSPDRYGANATVGLRFEFSRGELAPPPLTGLKIFLPPGLTYANPTLGLPICQQQALEELGASGCPKNSRLGTGWLSWEVPFGFPSGKELPSLAAFAAPPHEGHTALLFWIEGKEPVSASVQFGGELLPGSGTYAPQLDLTVPLIRSVPGGPFVPTDLFEISLGTNKLTIKTHIHHKLVRYHPRGIVLPHSCPKGKFPFLVQATFQGGTSGEASATVPCPRRRA